MRLAYAALAVLLAMTEQTASAQISFDELLARPRPAAEKHIAYGTDADQFGELYLPKAPGPHPVAMLIHGGCWSKRLPGLELMAYVAADLRGRGFAVWNVEYRRLGGAGGGYPGTFLDAGAAVDELRALAPQFSLDLHHIVLIGHSAGGHLALWAAARNRLPANSPLRHGNPLPVSAVVALSGINDLRTFHDGGPGVCGEPRTVDRLVATATRTGDPYADTSPAAMLPLGVKQLVVTAQFDDIVPLGFGAVYTNAARAAGDFVQYQEVASAGHFDLIDPRSPAWTNVVPLIENLAH